MSSLQKNKPEFPASPPNPGRRKLFRNASLAVAALAIGCGSDSPISTTRVRVYKNTEFRVGSSRLFLDSCRDEEGTQAANFRIYRSEDNHSADSISVLVPGIFKIREGETEYEVDVESISCTQIQSADLLIVTKSIPAEGRQSTDMPLDITVAGAAFTFLGAIISWITSRRAEHEDRKGIPLSPKRPPA